MIIIKLNHKNLPKGTLHTHNSKSRRILYVYAGLKSSTKNKDTAITRRRGVTCEMFI